MESRSAKLLCSSAGGSAYSHAQKYRVGLPSAWVKAMALSQDSPDLELTFENDTITIRKRSAKIPEDFMRSARIDRHQVKIYRYYHADTLCSTIYADFTSRMVSIENHTNVLIHRAFGCNLSPTWQDFLIFLEERCVPRTRSGLDSILEAMNLDTYDPVKIVEQTEGRIAGDLQWLSISEVK